MRELVRGADDERVEGIARAENAEVGLGGVGRGLLFGDRLRDRDLGHERRAQVFGHEGDRRTGALDFRQRFLDDRRVVLGQPVAEERVGDADADRAVAIGHESGRLEPGVEAVPVDLRLDAGEDLVPDIAPVMCVFGTFRPPGTR